MDLILGLPSASLHFALNITRISEHIGKWNMKSLAEPSKLEHQSDVSSTREAVSHEVTQMKTQTKGRLN